MSAVEQQVIPAADVRAAEQKRTSLVEKMAAKYGLEANKMMATLKATAFRGDVTNEQMAALLIVADQHNLNPWLKEIYAFPSRQGIVPIVGVDGWARITNEHPQFDGMDFKLEGEPGKEAITCTIYRKDRAHPVSVTEYMTECKRPTDPWNSHPLRMLRHKAMIQCARIAFSFAGIYDPDEGERILAAEQAIDVTPGQEAIPAGKKVGPKKLREVVEGIRKACGNLLDDSAGEPDAAKLHAIYGQLDSDQQLFVWDHLQSWERAAVKKLKESPAYKIAESGLDLAAWAVETIHGAKDVVALERAYATIQELYAEHDQEVPLDIQTVRQDRLAELGA